MAAMGAMPAVAASKVASVMPRARAVTRASARKAADFASPGRAPAGGGGAIGMLTAGAGGGCGLGALVAQPATSNRATRAASRCEPGRGSARKAVRTEGRRAMVHWYI